MIEKKIMKILTKISIITKKIKSNAYLDYINFEKHFFRF